FQALAGSKLPRVYVNLGELLLRPSQAPRGLELALEVFRQKTDPLIVRNTLAWVFATSPQAAYRDGPEAVRLALLVTQTKPGKAAFLDTLAAAYAEVKLFTEAVDTLQKAIGLAEKAGQTALAGEMRPRLALYRSKKPYRPPE
ncbi:hypothetical protein LCGC14_3072080, partial [marine sediment metagenome]